MPSLGGRAPCLPPPTQSPAAPPPTHAPGSWWRCRRTCPGRPSTRKSRRRPPLRTGTSRRSSVAAPRRPACGLRLQGGLPTWVHNGGGEVIAGERAAATCPAIAPAGPRRPPTNGVTNAPPSFTSVHSPQKRRGRGPQPGAERGEPSLVVRRPSVVSGGALAAPPCTRAGSERWDGAFGWCGKGTERVGARAEASKLATNSGQVADPAEEPALAPPAAHPVWISCLPPHRSEATVYGSAAPAGAHPGRWVGHGAPLPLRCVVARGLTQPGQQSTCPTS